MISRKSATLVLAAPLAFALGCAHGDAARNEPSSDTEHHAKAQPRPGKAPAAAPVGQPSLAAPPAGLLEPAARERIAQALTDKGFLASDAPTEEALTEAVRKFQEKQGLAATGFPDQETVRRLGIDPKDLVPSRPGHGGSGNTTSPSDDSPKEE